MIFKDSLVYRRQVIDELSGEIDYGDKLSGITRWGGDPAKQPTEEAIQAKLAEMQAEWDTQEYARNRQAEYPTVQELVVALYDEDDKTAIEAKRAEIKAKYPKPE